MATSKHALWPLENFAAMIVGGIAAWIVGVGTAVIAAMQEVDPYSSDDTRGIFIVIGALVALVGLGVGLRGLARLLFALHAHFALARNLADAV